MGLKGILTGNPMRLVRTLALGAITLAAMSLMLIGTAGSAGASSIPTGGTKVSGGTVRWAEPPGTPPTYIFPFMSSSVESVSNSSQFQYMMYRPLYMFGFPSKNSTTLNPTLSLASIPTYSNNNTTATVALKNYKWSDGESVTASDVVFFMNMLHAETANWYDYVPGLFPDNVKSVVATSPSEVTFTFNKSYEPTWMTYNELSQITPFPTAWDITSASAAAGSGGCSSGTYGGSSTDAACTAVYNFLNAQASNISGFSSSPIWSVVDGPYTIAASKGGSFNSSGQVTLVPNSSYSGPQKATVTVQELPFTTDNAEFNALVGGNVDVGYVPQQDITQNTSNATNPGPNNPRLTNFYLSPWVLYGYNYAVEKFDSTGDGGNAGAIYKQLYFRQAVQSMVDQPAMIAKFLKGYGVPTYGPVPVLPKNNLVDSYEESNPYPYNPSHAKSLLTSHGWKVVPNGTDTCQKPGTAPERVRRQHPQGCEAQFHHGLRQRDTMAAADDDGRAVGLELHRHQDRPRQQHVPDRDSGLRRALRDRVPLHGRRRLVGRRLGVQPGLLPLW